MAGWRRAAGASWPAPMAMSPGLSLRHRVPLQVWQPPDGEPGIGASCSGLPTSMHSGHCWRQRWQGGGALLVPAGQPPWPCPQGCPSGIEYPYRWCNSVDGSTGIGASCSGLHSSMHSWHCWRQRWRWRRAAGASWPGPHGHAPRAVPPASSTPTGVQLRDGSTGIGASCSELHSSMHSWHCWRQRWRWRRAAGASWPAPMAMPPGLSLRHRVPLQVCNSVTDLQA